MKYIVTAFFFLLTYDAATCGTSQASARRAIDSVTVNSWSLAIVAEINSARDSLGLLGVEPDATANYDPAYDVPHPPDPPGDYAEFYFPHSGGTWPVFLGNRYATDIRSSVSPRWIGLAGASFSSGSMTLSWDTTDIAQLPAGYDLVMKDSSTSTIIPMRHQSSYSFAFSGARIFVFWIEYSSTIFSVQPKWNLVSVPVTTLDYLKLHLFPTAISAAYSYGGSYKTEALLENGKGYWVKFATPDVIAITGTALPTVDVPLIAGWNLIGSVDHEIPAPAGGTIISNCFGYNGAYAIETTLKPGMGYWVKSSGVSTITLGGSSAFSQAATKIPDEAARRGAMNFTFTDSRGTKQTLYLAPDRHVETNSGSYELPPSPPDAGFDIRFLRQGFLEFYKESETGPQEYLVEVHATHFPVTITSEDSDPSKRITVTELIGKISSGSRTIAGNEPVIVSNPEVRELLLTIRPAKGIESAFALDQNYPNPFNPSTRLSFVVGYPSFVSLKVFDVLGREVVTLVDGVKSPGAYGVSWDAASNPAGVYYYRLEAGKFVEVRKMVLVK